MSLQSLLVTRGLPVLVFRISLIGTKVFSCNCSDYSFYSTEAADGVVLVTVVRAALHEDQVVGGGDLHVAPV